ncbi:MAG TPA: type VI secretion system protein TssA [Pyrinomonadaceae bacterium]|jgi:type VI secretion system protein ImpA
MSAAAETTSPATETTATAASVADLEALLAPIAGENPAGESLQYSGLHDELREARRPADNLAQGDWKYETKAADYHQVISLATPALATQTKDLQVCAWLCEALVRLHGFPGLRDGLKLMRGLHEQFWENVYPEIDEGDLEARANSVAWMDRELALAIKEVPLTNAQGGVNYSYLGWEQSKQFDIPENLENLDAGKLAQMEELRAQALEEGKTTGEDWRKAFHNTRRAFYEETWNILNECWDEFQALDKVMDAKYDRQTPGLGSLKKSLDEVRTLVEKLLKEKRILEPDPVADAGSAEGEAGATGDGATGIGAGPVRTRQEALRRLAEVSDYFRRTEPHSPVAYLVQRAIKWGQMPLETWLQDVIKDDTVLGQLRETLGLNTPFDGSGGEQS